MRPLSKQFVISIAIIFTLQFSCNDNITGSRDYDQWYGQVVSEFVKLLVRPDGTVWAWGVNFNGTLGDGTTESRDIPGKVLNLTDVTSIDQSNGAAVAVDKRGNIWFWGFAGREGDNLVGLNIPVKIEGLTDIVLISAAYENLVMNSDGIYWVFNVKDRIPREVQFD